MRPPITRLIGGTLAILFVAGCAFNTRVRDQIIPKESHWQGRLAIQVVPTVGESGAPPQSFSASFELTGSSESGALAFFTPLGNTAANIQWHPGYAEVTSQGSTRRYETLGILVRELVGTDLPVTALFAWLHGLDEVVDGWQVNLAHFSEGKITAQRVSHPQAQLRLLLEP